MNAARARTPTLGVCYYPEHWPEERWPTDAVRMAEAGIEFVRVGEFAWSRIEPEPGRIELDWLERAIDGLGRAGLKVVLGTPTATPPKWLVDRMPDMVPHDRFGRPRGFGSRRHYDFSHEGYRNEAVRITRVVAERLGRDPNVVMWQTDNEYGCHDTVLSWSPVARESFRRWLAERYGSIDALNEAWGNVFWSMECRSFDEIELPNLTVTEANPAHEMDFRRHASEMVARFDAAQVAVLRELSPGRDICHNYMGRVLEFDHFALGERLDVATWDSYPLGFLEDRSERPPVFKRRFARAGDPDFQAFHHDLYRAVGRGRWWVMEQQPGPVNWAPHNPIPTPGMVRVWTWEAIAHGAECVSYFRWRQAPFAQEQMHAGLLRPDGSEAEGLHEAERVASEIRALKGGLDAPCDPAPVAIVFDYESAWAWAIQPQGAEFDYFRVVFDLYRQLRAMGQDVDFVPSTARDWSAHHVVLVPAFFAWTDAAREAMAAFEGEVLVGPRTGSKTDTFRIPYAMPPDTEALPITVERVESLPPGSELPCKGGGALQFWAEQVEPGEASVQIAREDGRPALLRAGCRRYLAGWPDDALARRVLALVLADAGLQTLDLPDAVRVRTRGSMRIVTNYGDEPVRLDGLGLKGKRVLGDGTLRAHDVAILKA